MKNIFRTHFFHQTVILIFSLFLCMPAQNTAGQTLKYNNESEVYGAAAASPESGRQMLRKLTALCSKYGIKASAPLADAVDSWETRHAAYLEENARIKQELIAYANLPATNKSAKDYINRMFDVILPQGIQAQFQAMSFPITSAPTPEASGSLCNDFAAAINDGKFDLKRNDPVVAKFLDDRIAKSNANKELLIGKWRHNVLIRVIDGHSTAPQHFNGETTLEFKPDGTWSLLGSNSRSAGTYRWVNHDRIEQTIVESNLAIQIGMVATKQIRVDDDRLNITVTQSRADMERYMPPATPGVRRPNEVTIITTFSRVTSE